MQTPATFAKFCADRVVRASTRERSAKDIDLVGHRGSYFRIKNYEITGRPALHPAGSADARQPVLVLG